MDATGFTPLNGFSFHVNPGAGRTGTLKRCFSIDVLQCASCGGRMKLVALLTDLQQVRRFLRGIGEPTEPPPREPARGPPFWKVRGQVGFF